MWQDLVVKNGRKYLARSFHIICTEKIAILFLRCNVFDSKMLIFYTESFDKKLPLDPILHSYSGANNMLSHLYSIPFLFIELALWIQIDIFYWFGPFVNHRVDSICQIQIDHIIMILFFSKFNYHTILIFFHLFLGKNMQSNPHNELKINLMSHLKYHSFAIF